MSITGVPDCSSIPWAVLALHYNKCSDIFRNREKVGVVLVFLALLPSRRTRNKTLSSLKLSGSISPVSITGIPEFFFLYTWVVLALQRNKTLKKFRNRKKGRRGIRFSGIPPMSITAVPECFFFATTGSSRTRSQRSYKIFQNRDKWAWYIFCLWRSPRLDEPELNP